MSRFVHPPWTKTKKKVRCHNMVPNFSLLCFSSTVQQHTILHISFFFFFFLPFPFLRKKNTTRFKSFFFLLLIPTTRGKKDVRTPGGIVFYFFFPFHVNILKEEPAPPFFFLPSFPALLFLPPTKFHQIPPTSRQGGLILNFKLLLFSELIIISSWPTIKKQISTPLSTDYWKSEGLVPVNK